MSTVLTDETVSTSAPVSTDAPPAQVSTEPAAPVERRDFIKQQLENPSPRPSPARPRDQQTGKFVPSDASPATVSSTPVVDAPPRPSMPKSLRLELAPHWEKTPAELQAAINQREADYEKGVLPLKEKARVADELLNEFKPYEQMLQREGATPQTAIRQLLQTAVLLRTGSPEQKARAVLQTMQQFNISQEHLQSVLSGNAPTQPQQDPQISYLHQQVQQLTAAQQQAQNASTLAAIKRFETDPAHKHFGAVSDRMTAILQNPATVGLDVSGMEPDERLKAAYDVACRLDPTVYQSILAEQQQAMIAANQNRTNVATARNAAVQVSGSPSAAPASKPNPNDRRSVIANAYHAQR